MAPSFRTCATTTFSCGRIRTRRDHPHDTICYVGILLSTWCHDVTKFGDAEKIQVGNVLGVPIIIYNPKKIRKHIPTKFQSNHTLGWSLPISQHGWSPLTIQQYPFGKSCCLDFKTDGNQLKTHGFKAFLILKIPWIPLENQCFRSISHPKSSFLNSTKDYVYIIFLNIIRKIMFSSRCHRQHTMQLRRVVDGTGHRWAAYNCW